MNELYIYNVYKGNYYETKLLITCIDVNYNNSLAIKLASLFDFDHILKMLIDYGGDIYVNNNEPLRLAIIHDNKKTAKLLINKGLYYKEFYDEMIELADKLENFEIKKLLIDAKNDLDFLYLIL